MLLRHECFVHARVADPHHILPSCITVVVEAHRLTGRAGVVVSDMASTGVAMSAVRKNTIRGFLRVSCCSVASKVHGGWYGVWLLLHFPPRSLPSSLVLAASTLVSTMSSTSSAFLLLLHWYHIHHEMLYRGCIHYLCDVVGALQLCLQCHNLLILYSVCCGEVCNAAALQRRIARCKLRNQLIVLRVVSRILLDTPTVLV